MDMNNGTKTKKPGKVNEKSEGNMDKSSKILYKE